MLNDLRYAVRALRAAPGFTVVAVATLGLGIAVNTIAFTLLNSLALRPMPVPHASGIVRIYPVDASGRRHNLFSYPDYQAYRDQASQVFDGVVAYIPSEVTLGRDGGRHEVRAGMAYAVSANYFSVLGIEPTLGRTFSPAEETQRDAARVAVISHALWQRRYEAALDVLGRTVTINGRPFSITGVGPARFVGTEPLATDVWVPLGAQPILDGVDRLWDRNDTWLLMLGRLQRGTARTRAERDLSVVASRLAADYPAAGRPARVTVAAGTFFTVDGELQPIIALLMGTVGLVLIIACANIANLSLARAASRRREIAVRLALGAARWRLIRHLLTESLLVGALGGLAGLLTSAWTLRLLYPIGRSLLPDGWTAVVLDLTPDVRVFVYTLALSVLAAVTFGLVPALQTTTPRIAPALREDDRTIGGLDVTRSTLRSSLVVLQLAVCLMLLAGAGLTARALQRTRTLDLGFQPGGVVYTAADLRRHGYRAPAAADFYRHLTERAHAWPGVTTVALTSHVPLTGGVRRVVVQAEGAPSPVASTITGISDGYFRALEIPLVAGRIFTPEEAAAGAPVALISDALARRFWPALSAVEGPALSRAGSERGVGKQIITLPSRSPLTVIGVVKDAADVAIWREKELSIYLPLAAVSDIGNLHLLVRTTADPDSVVSALRTAATALDPNLQFEARPLDSVLRLWILPSRVAAIAAAVLALLALLLASIGVYGVVACSVSRRTHEIGIRIALGANAGAVIALVLRQGATLIGTGLAAGLAGTFITTRLLGGLLAGVSPLDPLALGGAAAFLGLVAFAACYLPARRAASVDPIAALRMD